MPTTCHCAGGPVTQISGQHEEIPPSGEHPSLGCGRCCHPRATVLHATDTTHRMTNVSEGPTRRALLLTGGALASLFAVARLSGGPTAALARRRHPQTSRSRPRTCSSLPKTWRRRTSNVRRSRCPSRSMRSRQSSIATFGFETNRRSGSRSASGWRSTFCARMDLRGLRSTSVSSKTVRRGGSSPIAACSRSARPFLRHRRRRLMPFPVPDGGTAQPRRSCG